MLPVGQCGSLAFFLVFLGVAGFAASLVAILLALTRPRVALPFALLAIAVGALAIGLGRRATAELEAQIASAGLPESETAPMFQAARTCTQRGIQSGSTPLGAGVAALIIGLVRRRRASA